MKSIINQVIAGLIIMIIAGIIGYWKLYTPTVTIKTVGNMQMAPINLNSAPFAVSVKGVASNTKGKYVYLVVKDKNAERIEPGLGHEVLGGEFEGSCYLGIENDPSSIGGSFTIFAVVTNRSFNEYEVLDWKAVKAKSKQITLIRTH